MKLALRESEVVTAAAAGATAYLLIKRGLGGTVPSIGPVGSPLVLIIAGLALASFVDGGGTTGRIVDGVAYGMIAAGAIAL